MKIKMLVMDVDGTLTDGHIFIGLDGEAYKAFNVKDGYGIVKASKSGIVPVIITGRSSQIVSQRAKELGIAELHQGVSEKDTVLKDVAQKYGVKCDEIAYIGDDLNDTECMSICGVTACPNDAVQEVKKIVTYVCEKKGGEGAVREFIDYLLK